jgi:hypothetical protein
LLQISIVLLILLLLLLLLLRYDSRPLELNLSTSIIHDCAVAIVAGISIHPSFVWCSDHSSPD